MRIRSLLSLSAAVLVGALGVAPAAFAADGDTVHLIALTARNSAQNGATYEVKPGATVPVEAGVANLGNKSASGLVVHLWFIGSKQRLTDNYSNCQYYLDGSAQGAWCEFGQEVAAAGKYSLPPLHVSVPKDATETRTLVEIVYSKEYAESRGGIPALAKAESGGGSLTLVPGTGAKGDLREGTDLTPSKQAGAVSFIYFHLIVPSTRPTSATTRPTATPTATAGGKGGSGAQGGQGGSTGGSGLAVTGSNAAAVAGAGAVLLAGGAAAFLLTRRRRAKFTA